MSPSLAIPGPTGSERLEYHNDEGAESPVGAMAGLEGIDASSMEIIDALGAVRYAYDEEDHIARPLVRHADRVPVAVNKNGERVIERTRFGMPVAGGRLITNARDDKLATARSWAGLVKKPEHRCLTAVSYVVERDKRTDTAYRIQRRDGKLMVVPGLCAVRHYSFASTGNEYDDLGHVQITADANELVAQVHDRFVCELADADDRDAWMSTADDVHDLLPMLGPADNERYEMVPIASDVWTRRNDPTAVEPTGKAVVWGSGGARQSTLF